MSKTLVAISAIIGTVIGAGVLGIPYVVAKSGFPIGIAHMILIGIFVTLTMLYLGEITLRTKQDHQLTGYASKYLGKNGRKIMLLAFIFEVFSALVAYMIGEGESFSNILFGTSAYSVHLAIAFWLFMSFVTYFGLKALEEGESIGVIFLIVMLISVAIFAGTKINPQNLAEMHPENWFTPFGVILFAFLGFTIIPELERILGKEKRLLMRSVIIANVICFVLYALFTITVVGFKGTGTPEIATIALGRPFILLGIFTMFTSYLALATAFIDTLRLDFKKHKITAWLITSIVPAILYLILKFTNNTSFTKVLSFGGILAGGLMAALIMFMVEKAKKYGDDKPAYSMPYHPAVKWIIIALFVIGMFLEIKALLA